MKVDDLKSLATKLVDKIKKENAEGKFQEFAHILARSLQGDKQKPVTPQKDNLFACLRSFDELSLTYSEKGLFSVLGYDEYVGETAVKEIEAILYDANFDPAGVINKIEGKQKAFKDFAERNRMLQTALDRVPTTKDIALGSGESLLEITFTNNAAVDNMVDFQEWIASWTIIIREFSELSGEKPESSRIVFVQKSSPLILDIAMASSLVLLMGKAVDLVLMQVERYLKIRKLSEAVKKLELDNKKIEQDIENEALVFSDKTAQEIAREITDKIEPKPSNEIVNGISLSIRNLFVFIDKGGRVDCTFSGGDDKNDVNNVFKSIRKLQQDIDRIRLLPSPENVSENR